jgi:hypothetical protein
MSIETYCAGTPLEVGTEPVLLIDNATVEDRWGVRRVLNRPIKDPRNPVLMPDAPWEDGISAPTVIYDPEHSVYRMWYLGCNQVGLVHMFHLNDWRADRDGYPYFVCYAESRDGVHWERPLLDDKPFGPHARSNVVIHGVQKAQSPHVMWNPPGTGLDGRFLMTYKDNLPQGYGSLCLATSDDGIHWREDPRNPAFVGLRDTWHNMVYDPARARWLMFTRPVCTAGVAGVPGGPTEVNYKRRTAVTIGDTPYEFKTPRVIVWPEEDDDPDIDHTVVSRVGSHFLGFVGRMGPPPRMEFSLHLSFSHDGLSWSKLPGDSPYIPHGGPDSFDAGSTSSAGSLVTMGDTSFLYYLGATQGQAQSSKNKMVSLGRAQFLRDRFVAQMGAHTGGFLLTREMVVAAPELVVNTTIANGYNSDPAHATVPPEFRVEVLRFEAGRSAPVTVPGYGLEDCVTKAVDLIEYKVTWKEKQDLFELVGKPVFLRFYLKNAGIYSLSFRHGG